jgi:hypothetical protein
MGNVLTQAQEMALAVKDDASAEQATDMGVAIKTRLLWLKGKRKEVYEPLYQATERVRNEYDNPIKLGTQLEKTLIAAVIRYKLDKKREEDRLRLQAEADARRIREEAERKQREAEAERRRVQKEQEDREQKRRDEAAAQARAKQAEIEAKRKAEQARFQAEQDERERLRRQEEDERLKKAQEAHDVGLGDRSDAILEQPTAIAPIAQPLPTAAQIQAQKEQQAKEKAESEELERQRQAAKAEEDRRREEDAARVRNLQEDAEKAQAEADAAESAAAAQITVGSVDNRMRTSGRWQYAIDSEADFRKLLKAVHENRVPIRWLGFDPQAPEKFREPEIGRYVTKFRNDPEASAKQAELAAIGIRTWLQEDGGFVADREEV